LDLEQILENLDVLIYQRYEQFFLIPKPYLEQFSKLPYEYIGMPLGTWQNDTFAPSHLFVSRFGHQFTQGMIVLDDQHTKLWITGRDIRQPKTDLVPQGQFLLVKDLAGRNLGLGKLLPKRLRNLLPRYLI